MHILEYGGQMVVVVVCEGVWDEVWEGVWDEVVVCEGVGVGVGVGVGQTSALTVDEKPQPEARSGEHSAPTSPLILYPVYVPTNH